MGGAARGAALPGLAAPGAVRRCAVRRGLEWLGKGFNIVTASVAAGGFNCQPMRARLDYTRTES